MKSNEYMLHSCKNDRSDKQYAELAERVLGNALNDHPRAVRLIHMALGISGEAGEVTDIIKKNFMYDKKLDIDHLKEELGDMLWYMSNLLDEIGSTFEEVMQLNVDKLAKRYPKGEFSEKDALERKDKVEPQVGRFKPGDFAVAKDSVNYLKKNKTYRVRVIEFVNNEEFIGLFNYPEDMRWSSEEFKRMEDEK